MVASSLLIIVLTGNEAVASAEAAAGVIGVGRVEDEQQARIGCDQWAG